jgi:hypothetical protein
MGIDPTTEGQRPAKAPGTMSVDGVVSVPDRAKRGKLSDEELAAKWLAISEENRRRFPEMPGSADIDALLYDPETGLPIDDGTDFSKTDVLIA